MQIVAREVDLVVDGRIMRTRVCAPRPAGRYPGVLLYSEIFQLTGPIQRATERLAGHGFVVAAPEIFHRIEAPGAAIPYDDVGRDRGLAAARRTTVAEYDRDARAVLDFLASDPRVQPECYGAMGFCIGGHLALRAALDARVGACVACYPTGVHNGALGADPDAGTLAQLSSARGELLIVFGSEDPHVPADGRALIARALGESSPRRRIVEYPAEHAFMRDEGARYDAAAADAVWNAAIAFLRRCLVEAPC